MELEYKVRQRDIRRPELEEFSNKNKEDGRLLTLKGVIVFKEELDFLQFSNIQFVDCNFRGCSLKNTLFNNCKFSDCLFEECFMQGTELDNCDIHHVTLVSSNLSYIDIRSSRINKLETRDTYIDMVNIINNGEEFKDIWAEVETSFWEAERCIEK